MLGHECRVIMAAELEGGVSLVHERFRMLLPETSRQAEEEDEDEEDWREVVCFAAQYPES